MSKPRYGWWSYAKYMIRRYPDLLEKYTRLHETKITPNLSGMPGGGGTSNPTEKAALKELTPIEQKEFDAVHSAVMETGRMKTGADRIKVVKLVLWDRSHTLTGAAMKVHISEPTAWRWHGEFIKLVAEKYGFFEKMIGESQKNRIK